jgi:cell division protease FtsH
MKGLLQGKRPVREDTSSSAQQPPRGSAVPATGQKPAPDVDGLSPNPV